MSNFIIKFRVWRGTSEPGFAVLCDRCRRTTQLPVAIECGELAINLCKHCLGTAYGLPDELLAHPQSKDITAEWVPGIEGGDRMVEQAFTVEPYGPEDITHDVM